MAIYLPYVIQTGDFGAQASVHTKELLVEESGERQAVKRIHTGVINMLRVLYFTWKKRCRRSVKKFLMLNLKKRTETR